MAKIDIFKPCSNLEFLRRKIIQAIRFECFKYELALVSTISTIFIAFAICMIFGMILKSWR